MTGSWQFSLGTSTFRPLDAELRVFFTRRVKDGFDPRDLVSDVWLAAGRYFAGRSSLRHYLFTIARTTLADHWRRQSRQPELIEFDEKLPASMPSPESALRELCEHTSMMEALAELEPHHRSVIELKLRSWDNYQIGKELGISYSTVRSRLHRAIRRLRKQLRGDG